MTNNLLCRRNVPCWVLGVLFIVGCTYVNKPLNDPRLPLEQRRRNNTRSALLADISAQTTQPAQVHDADGTFVGLALSGGGSRSANFSAACMFQLQRVGLLGHVDCISSVSGGSLTAAYYCLNDKAWNPKDAQERLSHSFASDIIFNTFVPWNTLVLALSDWDRSDLLAQTLRQHLFSRQGRALTFADLRADRPRLLINATDLQSGRSFVFCNETFDELNSDLGKYPIAYAVAASASFPVVMHQVTLRDHSTVFKQYRHLIDGGVTDNLGIVTLIQTYEAQLAVAEEHRSPDPYPNGAVFIVIDARTQFDAKLSSKGDIGLIESISTGTALASTSLLARASSATLAEIILQHCPGDVTAQTLRDQIHELENAGSLSLKDRRGRNVRIVHLALTQLQNIRNVPFRSFSESVNNISTYFNIEDSEVYNLYQAAQLLMTERFEPLLRQIAGELPSAGGPR
jgi:predicted acylesterase/phospholipase RssA